jgi:hypothetical protein
MKARPGNLFPCLLLAVLVTPIVSCAAPGRSPNAAPTVRGGLVGSVIDEAGRPVTGARVRAHFTHGIPFQDPAAETRTGPEGRFRIAGLAAGQVQLEAIEQEDRKALGGPVAVAPETETDAGPLRIEATGELDGRVTGSASVSLLGTSVYVPGLPYAVRTDEAGHFRLKQLPRGTYRLVAEHASLGRISLEGFEVLPGTCTEGIRLDLPGGPPAVDQVNPTWVGPGSWLDIHGARLAIAPYLPVVYLGGRRLTEVQVVSGDHLRVKVDPGSPGGRVTVQVGDFSGTGSPSVHVATGLRWEPPAPWLVRTGSAFRPHVKATDGDEEALADAWVAWEGLETASNPFPAGAWPVVARLGDLSISGILHGAPIGELLRSPEGPADGENLVPVGEGALTGGPAPAFWTPDPGGRLTGRPIDLSAQPAPRAWGASVDGQRAAGAWIEQGTLSLRELAADGTWRAPALMLASVTSPVPELHVSAGQDGSWIVTYRDALDELWTCRTGETPRSWGRGNRTGPFGVSTGDATWCGWWQTDASPPRLLLAGPEGGRELTRALTLPGKARVTASPGSTWIAWEEAMTGSWRLKAHEIVGGQWLVTPTVCPLPRPPVRWTINRGTTGTWWGWSDEAGIWLVPVAEPGAAEIRPFPVELGAGALIRAIAVDAHHQTAWWVEEAASGSTRIARRAFDP